MVESLKVMMVETTHFIQGLEYVLLMINLQTALLFLGPNFYDGLYTSKFQICFPAAPVNSSHQLRAG